MGLIPEDWEIGLLSDHFRIYAGGDVPKHSLSQDRSESHPYPIYANSLQNKGLYGFTSEHRAARDSLTITARGYLGHAEYRDEEFFPIVRLLVLEPLGKMDPKFTTLAINDRVKFAFESTGVPQLTAPQVGKYAIAAPKLSEQRDIANVIRDIDALLTAQDALIAKKRAIKQGAMQELLTGKRRLPGFSGEWETCQVTDMAHVKTGPFGSTLHESDYVQVGTPIITVEHLGEFGVTRQNLPLVSDEDRKRLQAYSLQVGDIVFSRVGSVDRNALINKEESGWLFSGRLLRIRPDRNRAFPLYMSYQFQTEKFRNSVLTVAVGQTMASLNTRILNSLSVVLPPIAEQTAIASVLSDMDGEIITLESKRAKTAQLKQGMMQELLTGRIRLV